MTNTICLNKNYSTTKFLLKEKIIIKNKPEDKFETILFLPENTKRKDEGGLRTKGYFKKSYDDKPLISIITVVFNGEIHLEQTIQSVINQNYDNVEYIIIDGGSTDGTLNIIKKYEDQIDYWISEKDNGIYEAMNKGIKLATGAFIAFINADDWYEDAAVSTSIYILERDKVDYVFSNIQKVPSRERFKVIWPLEKQKVYQGMMYPHISAIIKKSVYQSVGLFDLQYKIAADFDMALRIHLSGYRASYNNQVIVYFREGGASANIQSKYENFKIAISNGKNPFVASIMFIVYLTKHFIKSKL